MNTIASPAAGLLKSEERLFAVIRNTPYVAIQWFDAQGRVLLWNEASEAMFGYGEAEALGKTLDELIHSPAQAQQFREALKTVGRTGQSIGPREFTFHRRNGELGTCLSSVFKIPGDDAGDWFVCMDVDITGRKQTEEALGKSHEELRAFFSQTINGCFFMMLDEPVRWDDATDKEMTLDYVFDHQRITQINDAMLAQYGATREAMLGLTPADLFEHNRAHGRELWRRLFDAGKIRLESDERKADGTPMWVEGEYILLYDAQGRVTGHFGIQRDITMRKRSEQSLKLFRSLIDRVNDGIEVIEPESGQFLDVNDYACRSHGYTRDEYLSLTVPQIDPLVAQQPWPEVLASIRRTDALVLETAHRRKDGSVFPVEVNCSSVHVDREYVLAVVRDISERKRAEQALRESEQRYKTIFQNAPDALFVMSADGDDVGRIVAANEQAARMHGLDLSAMINRNITEFDTPDSAQHAHERLRRIAAGERLTFEVEHVCHDGSCIPVEVTAGRIELNGRPHVLAFDRDITDRKRAERAEEERRRLEAQILHAQKLESLGVLAGGIAHDFNNLLTVVLGYASLALMQLPDESPARPMLREIEKGAQRATELTKQMLAYAGKGALVIEPLRLDTLVAEMNSLLQTAVSKKAIVQLHLAPATLQGDATQIRQVVMNLITNASDALADGAGLIRIATGVRAVDATSLASRFTPESLPAGDYAYVKIEDNGCGMSEETLSRIFDPFFTTKFAGRGLGLAGVLGIVRGHRGTIKVESAPGLGATFEVLLPSIDAAAIASGPSREHESPRGQGTVLVIDDEPGVCSFAQAALESAGFRVHVAGDGAAGLALFHQHRLEIAAVLLDLTMPQMDGVELLTRLQALAPRTAVLVMSGFDQQEFATQFAGLGASGFIQKPFHPRELIARMTELTSKRHQD